MGKKLMGWKTKGMNQDLSVSAFNPEFSFENMNLRLATNEHNTLMSWVNERGTKKMILSISLSPWQEGITDIIEGTPLGTAVINNYLIVFTHEELENTASIDRIYRLKKSSQEGVDLEGVLLYKNNLGFDLQHPLETLVNFESEDIQKVYWIDGIHQLRMINIAANSSTISKWEANSRPDSNYTCFFDAVPELQLKEKVYVKKLLGVAGMFAPGVIQYAFTYYNKNGQESHIFYTSPLLYISHRDRGAAQDDKVENAFRVTVEGCDEHFDYLRIYSIHRTSINATPECKRVQDIDLSKINIPNTEEKNVSYVDNGMSGDIVDPTELLYKGGDIVIANSFVQKDNTLFLGGITTEDKINNVEDTVKSCVSLSDDTRSIQSEVISTGSYNYMNQLTSLDSSGKRTVPCGGFKRGDYYRCGVQLQDKYGRWSKPIWKEDFQIANTPSLSDDAINLPVITGTYTVSGGEGGGSAAIMGRSGYKKIRPVVVFPNLLDRVVLCQGVVCPTMFTTNNRNLGALYAQSSWFFRTGGLAAVDANGAVSPKGTTGYLDYTSRNTFSDYYDPTTNIKKVEIWGDYENGNKFQVGGYTSDDMLTFHSPDVEFDDQLYNCSFIGTKYLKIGSVTFTKTLSDIDIQTETPTISNTGTGFIHKAFSKDGMSGIVSGLFYDDFVVDDDKDTKDLRKQPFERCPCKWMVHTWHKSGSLNNDINRPADKGTATAKLKKKIISNMRYASTLYDSSISTVGTTFSTPPQLFESDQNTILKFGSNIYRGNIDTALMPDHPDGMYFAFNDPSSILWQNTINAKDVATDFTSSVLWKTYLSEDEDTATDGYLYKYYSNQWNRANNNKGPGEVYVDLVAKKDLVRMRYKSTPHLVLTGTTGLNANGSNNLAIVEVLNPDNSNRFGGINHDALMENDWLPCGEPVDITGGSTTFEYSYGDTYFQRWDCLKTYPFTKEDENQVVEIGSFMLESRVNIDGRYDRNRGQASNLNVSPVNFNLLNPVYSQKDNFFTYKIMDDDYYQQHEFPNQIAWSLTKESGADVDAWTSITLASILEMDGDKGRINKLTRLNDQIICFQDTGISQILYNENAQISTTAGVPIELGNSGRVQGKRYISDTVGCSNKWSVVNTPGGIYFMDSNDKSIYLLADGLRNLSQHLGFSSWCKKNIPSAEYQWEPVNFGQERGSGVFVSYYDKQNQEVLFINSEKALAFSEKLGAFTSFYNYGYAQYFNNLGDMGIWLRTDSSGTNLWKHHAGEYGKMFGISRPYWMTLIGNPDPQLDKTFTNLEFRATVDGDAIEEEVQVTDSMGRPLYDGDNPIMRKTGRIIPYLPFDSLETWNEYQHGIAQLDWRNGHQAFMHHALNNDASLKRKFRIWRCDIPRDNYPISDGSDEEAYNAFIKDETIKGVSRFKKHPMDRMRNPWLYLKLMKKAEEEEGKTLGRAEIHDILMTYFE